MHPPHPWSNAGPTRHLSRAQAVAQVIGAASTSASRDPICLGLPVS
jgi:hypothetical protein